MGKPLTTEELYRNLSKEEAERLALVESFGSWGEFLDATERPSQMENEQRSSRDTESDESWDLKAGWKGAMELATKGWPKGAEKVINFAERFIADFTKQVTQESWQYSMEAGGNLDIAKYLEDEPECWLKIEEKQVPQQSVTIVINLVASCFVDSKDMEARGLQAANLAMALDAAGVKTRVIIGFHVGAIMVDKTSECYVTVKEFGEPLDIDNLVFTMVHPAAFRRLYFSYMETWNADLRSNFRVGHGYGRANGELAYKGDIYFESISPDKRYYMDDKKMLEYIKKNLEKFGVKLKEVVA